MHTQLLVRVKVQRVVAVLLNERADNRLLIDDACRLVATAAVHAARVRVAAKHLTRVLVHLTHGTRKLAHFLQANEHVLTQTVVQVFELTNFRVILQKTKTKIFNFLPF